MVLRVSRILAPVPATASTKPAGQRGDAGEALEEIEGGAFGGEDRTGIARHHEDDIAGMNRGAVGAFHRDNRRGVNPLENLEGDLRPGDDRILLGDDGGDAPLLRVDEELDRGVAGADVLGEREGDGVVGGRNEHGGVRRRGDRRWAG